MHMAYGIVITYGHGALIVVASGHYAMNVIVYAHNVTNGGCLWTLQIL